MKHFLCAAPFWFLFALPSGLAGQSFSSGPAQVSLLELYTSEGCSSCPPAEKWLGSLMRDADLWKDFVPVAFHVTYWDNLGWKDVAGQNAFNERQRKIAREWGTGTVYTPCLVLNGAEWHIGTSIIKPAQKNSVGMLEIKQNEGGSVAIVLKPSNNKNANYRVNVAVLGSGILTKVSRGENAGQNLAHDFVVLSQGSAVLQQAADQSWQANVSLPKETIPAPRRALVAWIEVDEATSPIQATGGWLE